MPGGNMTLYYSDTRGGQYNTEYPHAMVISGLEGFRRVMPFDHVGARYRDNRRRNANFIEADCLMLDVDNGETDDPGKWVDACKIGAEFPGVAHYISYSRNHYKSKGGKEPRPKFHVYFPIERITDAAEYRLLKMAVCKYFPAFDTNATDAARFFYGVSEPDVEYHDGETTLTGFMKRLPDIYKEAKVGPPGSGLEKDMNPEPQPIDAQPLTGRPKPQQADDTDEKGVIPAGKRNSTLSVFAGRMLKKYGDTDGKARKAFDTKAAACSPPLPDGERNTIWQSALAFYHDTIKASPGYTEPEQYNRRPSIWALPIVNNEAMTLLCAPDPKERKFSIAAARLFLQAIGVTIRINDMSKRVEIEGLPQKYSGEDASALLETLISDAASAIAYKRASSPIIHEVLTLLASENRYHPVTTLLNAGQWDGIDRLSEIYRILGVTDEFHKTLFKKWALQTIAVLYNTDNNPISAQGVLTIQGAQGIGKTEFFRHLAISEPFFKGGATLDTSNKDSLLSATKVWICELGEIDSTTKKEQSALKAFLTEQTDRFREPYARSETIRPRRTSFCGTVNPKGYLRDETGNRRYWTIPVERIDIGAVFSYPPEWYTQFWRQIHAGYVSNPKGYLLTGEEQETVNGRNNEFEAEIYGEDEFMTLFDIDADESKWVWQTAAQITETLNTSYQGLNIRSESVGGRLLPRIEKRVGKLLKRKIIRGRRLILCPPKSTVQFSANNDYPIPPLTGRNNAPNAGQLKPTPQNNG